MTRVLVVDDDAMVRQTIRTQLEHAGFVAETAEGGIEALERAPAFLADVLLIDVVMPGMDGPETIVQFRLRHPTVAIVAMSGGGKGNLKEFLACAERVGARVTLPKPFTQDELIAAITRAVALRRESR